jgi:hypothetical protein
MTRTKVLDLAALPDGGVELVVVAGLDVALFRRGDEIFAVGDAGRSGESICS